MLACKRKHKVKQLRVRASWISSLQVVLFIPTSPYLFILFVYFISRWLV